MVSRDLVDITVAIPREIAEKLAFHCAQWNEGIEAVVADALTLHFDALAVNDSSLALDETDDVLVDTLHPLVASQAFPGPL